MVKKRDEAWGKAFGKYILLAVVQMLSSAGLVTIGCRFLYIFPELLVKIVVDVCLFFISYRMQKLLVFRRKMR